MNHIKVYGCRSVTNVFAKNKEINEYINVLQYVDASNEGASHFHVFIFDYYDNVAREGVPNDEKVPPRREGHTPFLNTQYWEGEGDTNNPQGGIFGHKNVGEQKSAHTSPVREEQTRCGEMFIFYDVVFDPKLVRSALGMDIYERSMCANTVEMSEEKLILCRRPSDEDVKEDVEVEKMNASFYNDNGNNSKLKEILEALGMESFSSFSGTLLKFPLTSQACMHEICEQLIKITTEFILLSLKVERFKVQMNDHSVCTWERTQNSIPISHMEGESHLVNRIPYVTVRRKHKDEMTEYILHANAIKSSSQEEEIYFIHVSGQMGGRSQKCTAIDASQRGGGVNWPSYIHTVQGVVPMLIKSKSRRRIQMVDITKGWRAAAICDLYMEFLLLLRELNLSCSAYDFLFHFPDTLEADTFSSLYRQLFEEEKKLKLFFNGYHWMGFSECVFIPYDLKDIFENCISDIVKHSDVKNLLFFDERVKNALFSYLNTLCEEKKNVLAAKICKRNLLYIENVPDKFRRADRHNIDDEVVKKTYQNRTNKFFCEVVIQNAVYVQFQNWVPILSHLLEVGEHSIFACLKSSPCFPNEEKVCKRLSELVYPLDNKDFYGMDNQACNQNGVALNMKPGENDEKWSLTQGENQSHGDTHVMCDTDETKNKNCIGRENLLNFHLVKQVKEEGIERMKLLGLTILEEQYKLNDDINDIFLDLDKLYHSKNLFDSKLKVLNKIIFQLEKNMHHLEDPLVQQRCRERFFLPLYRSKHFSYAFPDGGDASAEACIALSKKTVIRGAPNGDHPKSGVASRNANNATHSNGAITVGPLSETNNTPHRNISDTATRDVHKSADACGRTRSGHGNDQKDKDFVKICDAYDRKYFNLIFLKRKCYHLEKLTVSPELGKLLQLEKSPPLAEVLGHLELFCKTSKNTCFQKVSKVYDDIYDYLEKYIVQQKSRGRLVVCGNEAAGVKANDTSDDTAGDAAGGVGDSSLQGEFCMLVDFVQRNKFIYIKNKLWRGKEVFSIKNTIPFNLFLCELPKLYRMKYPNLVELSCVQGKLKHSNLVSILNKIVAKLRNKLVTPDEKHPHLNGERNEAEEENELKVYLSGLLKISYINTLNLIDVSVCDWVPLCKEGKEENLPTGENEKGPILEKMNQMDKKTKPQLKCPCFDGLYLPNSKYLLVRKENLTYVNTPLLYSSSSHKSNVVHRDVKENIIDLLNVPKTGKKESVELNRGTQKIHKRGSNQGEQNSIKKGPIKSFPLGENKTRRATLQISTISKARRIQVGRNPLIGINNQEANKKKMTSYLIEHKKKEQLTSEIKKEKGKEKAPTVKREPKLLLPQNGTKKRELQKGNELNDNILFREIKNLIYFLDDIGCLDIKLIADKRNFTSDTLPKVFLKRTCLCLYIKVKKEQYENLLMRNDELNVYADAHNVVRNKEYLNGETNNLESLKSCNELICSYLFENLSGVLDYLLIRNGSCISEWCSRPSNEMANGRSTEEGTNKECSHEQSWANPDERNTPVKVVPRGSSPEVELPNGTKSPDRRDQPSSPSNQRDNLGRSTKRVPPNVDAPSQSHRRVLYKKNHILSKKDEELAKNIFFHNYFRLDEKNKWEENGYLRKQSKIASASSRKEVPLRGEKKYYVRQTTEIGSGEYPLGGISISDVEHDPIERTEMKRRYSDAGEDQIICIRLYNKQKVSILKMIERVFLECKKYSEKFFFFSKNLLKLDIIKINEKGGRAENATNLGICMSDYHLHLREEFYNAVKKKQLHNWGQNKGQHLSSDETNCNNLEIFLQCQIYNGSKSSRWIIGLLHDVRIAICFEHYQIFRKHLLFQNFHIVSNIDNLPMHICCNLFDNNGCNLKKLKNGENLQGVLRNISILYQHFLMLAHRNAVKKLLKQDPNKVLYKCKGKWVKRKLAERHVGSGLGIMGQVSTVSAVSAVSAVSPVNGIGSLCSADVSSMTSMTSVHTMRTMHSGKVSNMTSMASMTSDCRTDHPNGENARNTPKEGNDSVTLDYIYKVDKRDIKNFSQIYQIFKTKYLNFIPKKYDKNDFFSSVVRNVFLNCPELQILPCLKKKEKIYALYWSRMNDCVNIYPFCKYLNQITFFLLDLGLTVLLPYYEIDNIVHMHKMVSSMREAGGLIGSEKKPLTRECGVEELTAYVKEKKDDQDTLKTGTHNENIAEQVLNLTPCYLRNRIKKYISIYLNFVKECLSEKNFSTVIYFLDYLFSDFKKHDELYDTLVKDIKCIPLLVILNYGTSYLKMKLEGLLPSEGVFSGGRFPGGVPPGGLFPVQSSPIITGKERLTGQGEGISCESNEEEIFKTNCDEGVIDGHYSHDGNLDIIGDDHNEDAKTLECDESIGFSFPKQNDPWKEETNRVVPICTDNLLKIKNSNFDTEEFFNYDFIHLIKYEENRKIYTSKYFYLFDLDSVTFINVHFYSASILSLLLETQIVANLSFSNLSQVLRHNLYPSIFHPCSPLDGDDGTDDGVDSDQGDALVCFRGKGEAIHPRQHTQCHLRGEEYQRSNNARLYNCIQIAYDANVIIYSRLLLDMISELCSEQPYKSVLHTLNNFRLLITFDESSQNVEKTDNAEKAYMYVHSWNDIKNILSFNFGDTPMEATLYLLGYKKMHPTMSESSIFTQYLINDYEDVMISLCRNGDYLNWSALNREDMDFLLLAFLSTIKFNSNNISYLKAMPIFYSLNCSTYINLADKNRRYIVVCTNHLQLFSRVLSQLRMRSSNSEGGTNIGVMLKEPHVSRGSRGSYMNTCGGGTTNGENGATITDLRQGNNKEEGHPAQGGADQVDVLSEASPLKRSTKGNHFSTTRNNETSTPMKYTFLHHSNVSVKYWKHINIECWYGYDIIANFLLQVIRDCSDVDLFHYIVLFMYKEYEDMVEEKNHQAKVRRKKYSGNIHNVCDSNEVDGLENRYGEFLINIFGGMKEVRLKFRGHVQIAQLYNANSGLFRAFINDNKLFQFVHLTNLRYEKEFLEKLNFHVNPSMTELNNFLSILINVVKRTAIEGTSDVVSIEAIFHEICVDNSRYDTKFDQDNLHNKMHSLLQYAEDNLEMLLKKRDENFAYLMGSLMELLLNNKRFASTGGVYKTLETYFVQKGKARMGYLIEGTGDRGKGAIGGAQDGDTHKKEENAEGEMGQAIGAAVEEDVEVAMESTVEEQNCALRNQCNAEPNEEEKELSKRSNERETTEEAGIPPIHVPKESTQLNKSKSL
ncbi:hypothetical protein C922_01085 [Plasmodium inui San Antonio 1]|uniref:Uncharacterized protein n=1 Tax=Plasmodium inui San Antonio 1 TaxID=1237626 RepID=W7AAF0_9APIC|nr:hypothetical protein C922_01085 [Plasmodium inui San Antonio 1]EUD68685.1 hypothetical protein C922_01085 [Plasmodium inui San Antonio 1]